MTITVFHFSKISNNLGIRSEFCQLLLLCFIVYPFGIFKVTVYYFLQENDCSLYLCLARLCRLIAPASSTECCSFPKFSGSRALRCQVPERSMNSAASWSADRTVAVLFSCLNPKNFKSEIKVIIIKIMVFNLFVIK